MYGFGLNVAYACRSVTKLYDIAPIESDRSFGGKEKALNIRGLASLAAGVRIEALERGNKA